MARALRDAVRRRRRWHPLHQGNTVSRSGWAAAVVTPSRPRSGRRPVIAVLDYGIGNLRSAEKALQHLGADARLVSDPDEAAAADGMVLPGVGSFGRCARALRSSGLDRAARSRRRRPGALPRDLRGLPVALRGVRGGPRRAPGLGVLAGTVRRLPPGSSVPRCSGTCWTTDAAGRRRLLAGVRDRPGCTSCTPSPPNGPTRPWPPVTTAAPWPPRPSGARCGGPSSTPRSPGPWAGHPGQFRARPCDQTRRRCLMDLYPAIDMRDGEAVRLTQGDFARQQPVRRPPRSGPALRGRRRPLAARGRPRRRPHRAPGQPGGGPGHRRGGRRPGRGRRRGAQPRRRRRAAGRRGGPGGARYRRCRATRTLARRAGARATPAGWPSASTTAGGPTGGPRWPAGAGSRGAGAPWPRSLDRLAAEPDWPPWW